MFTLQESFQKNKNLITNVLLMVSLAQAGVVLISNVFDLGVTNLRGLSSILSFSWFATVIVFPFLLVKKTLHALPPQTKYRCWLMGLVVSILLSSIIFVLGIIDLAIKVFLLHDARFIVNANTVIFGSIMGSFMLIIIGTLSSWISQMTFKDRRTFKRTS